MRVIAKRNRVAIVAGLVLAALVLRVLRGVQEPVVNPDTIRFIEQAQAMDAGGLQEAARSEVYHPLHAMMGLGVHEVIGRFFADDRAAWLWSMQGVGILCGAILCAVIYRLARVMGAPFWASVGAAALWAVGRRSVSYGPDGISDMLFLLLFGLSMLTGMRAMRGLHDGGRTFQRWRFALAGALSGLAYWTRPEGLAAALILATTMLIVGLPRPYKKQGMRRFKLFSRRRVPLGTALAGSVILLGATLLVSTPYMMMIGGVTQKKALVEGEEMREEIMTAGLGAAPVTWRSLNKVTMEVGETFGYAGAALLLGAMALKPTFWGRARLRVLTVVWVGLWGSVMFWLLRKAGYLDGRHTLPLQLLMYGMLALGLLAWRRPMLAWQGWWRQREGGAVWARLPAWRKTRAWVGGSVVVIWGLAMLPGLVRLVKPTIDDHFYIREAAAWVAAHSETDAVVCDEQRLVGYYSGRKYALWQGSPGEPQLEKVEKAGAEQVILAYVFRPGLGDVIQERIGVYRAVARFESKGAERGEVMVIYKK